MRRLIRCRSLWRWGGSTGVCGGGIRRGIVVVLVVVLGVVGVVRVRQEEKEGQGAMSSSTLMMCPGWGMTK